MSCHFIGTNVNPFFEKEISKVAEKQIKTNSAKAIQILSARINEDFEGFRKFLVNYLNGKNIKKENGEGFTIEEFKDIESVVDVIKGVKNHINHIDGALVAYYKHIYKSVNNYNTIIEDIHNLNFLTTSAEDEAVSYIAIKLVDMFYKNSKLPRGARIDNQTIFKQLKYELFENIYYNLYDSAVKLLKNNGKLNGNSNANKTVKAIKELDEQIALYRQAIIDYKKGVATKNADLVKSALNSVSTSEKQLTINDIAAAYTMKYNQYHNLVVSFVETNGTDIAKNYVAMYKALDNDYFKKRVSNHRLLHNFTEDVVEAFIVEENNNEDDSSIEIYDVESIDETTKRWNENVSKSFMTYVDSDMRYRLSMIPRATMYSPYGEDSKNSYDRDNQLGVETYYDVQEVVTALVDFADFNSIGSLINSIDNIAKTNPYFYGLSFLVKEMKDNFQFAASIWRNLAKPVVNKNMMVISMNGDIESIESNKNNTSRNSQINTLFNSVKSSYRSFNKEDIAAIQEMSKPHNIGKVDNFLIEKINYYFPKISKEAITSLLKADQSKELRKDLINILSIILNSFQH